MTSKISPENNQNNQNNWNVSISYFCIPVVCENNFLQISCCHYTNKQDNKGCVGCGYCFRGNDWTCCGIVSNCGQWFYSPLCCCQDDPEELFQDNCCLPCCLTSSILVKKNAPDNLYFHSCLGIWCVQKNHIHHFYDPICICMHGDYCRNSSPCNYGCGVGPVGFTAGGNCFPFCWDMQCGGFEIFYKYLCCLGVVHRTPKCDRGCSTFLPICLKRTEIIKNGKKVIQEKGVNYLLPWNVNIMQ